jgi:hypothetical protein
MLRTEFTMVEVRNCDPLIMLMKQKISDGLNTLDLPKFL